MHFRNIATFVRQHTTFSHPTSSLPKISPCSPGSRWMTFGLRKSEDVGLLVRAISFQDFQPMWSLSTNVTDEQTDDMWSIDHTFHCSASHGKNGISGSYTFHKSKLHITDINLLPTSVFKDPFHHFHSMFQQFNFSVRSRKSLNVKLSKQESIQYNKSGAQNELAEINATLSIQEIIL